MLEYCDGKILAVKALPKMAKKAQRVEHYEMAAYGTVRAIAEQLGHRQVVDLLQQTLDEEGAADKKLTQISEGGVLAAAGEANSEEEDE